MTFISDPHSDTEITELIGKPVEELVTPCLTVNLDLLESNIKNMMTIIEHHGVRIRPHIKTHKTPSGAKRQLAVGATGITTAKLSESWVFANHGFDDILLAYQVIGEKKIQNLIQLSREVNVCSCVDNLKAAEILSYAAITAGTQLQVLLDIDTGLKRTGCPPAEAVTLGTKIAALPGLELSGVFSFAGHQAGNPDIKVRKAWARNEAETSVIIAQRLRDKGIPTNIVSVSGTNCAKFAAEVDGVTEVRPGTYVFGDMNYARLGINTISDCALTIRSTIVGKPTKDRSVLDPGTKVFAADRPTVLSTTTYGYIPSYPHLSITRAWEEHSVIEAIQPESMPKLGEVVEIIPNHVCVVMNLAKYWFGIRNGIISEVHDVAARGLVI